MQEASLGRFGDRRLECVGGKLLSAMQTKRTLCVHRLGEDRKQAIQFGRFLDNRAVTVPEMLATAARHSNRGAGGKHVLAVMDTTDLRFPTHEASKQGFGRDANDTAPGLFLHPILAMEATTGGILGLVDCVVLNGTAGKVSDHEERLADNKGSRGCCTAPIGGGATTTPRPSPWWGSRERHLRSVRPPPGPCAPLSGRPPRALATAAAGHPLRWPA